MGTLSEDLVRLRKGRGVMASDLQQRIGPTLRALSGIDHECDQSEARRRLVAYLSSLASELPDDLRLAFTAGLALDVQLQSRFLEDRVRWLAGQLGRDTRTARRRVDEAIRSAEAISADSGPAGGDYVPSGWYLARFRALLRLDGPEPSAIEERTVVATRDDLAEVLVSTGIPRHGNGGRGPHGARFAVLYGGSLVRQERHADTYFRYVIRLPRPLLRAESHEFGVSITVPSGQPLNPRYALRPLRRCDEFDLRIRFGTTSQPAAVWNMDGIPQGMAEDYAAPGALLRPDEAGEIHLRYQHLRTGLVYGARWAN